MNKETCKRNHLIGVLPTVSEDESMVTMAGNMAAHRQHVTRLIVKSLYLIHKQDLQTETGPVMGF